MKMDFLKSGLLLFATVYLFTLSACNKVVANKEKMDTAKVAPVGDVKSHAAVNLSGHCFTRTRALDLIWKE